MMPTLKGAVSMSQLKIYLFGELVRVSESVRRHGDCLLLEVWK